MSVRVEGTEKRIAGAKLTLTPSPERVGGISTEVLKLPENEQDLLAYLTQLAAARGIVDGQLNLRLDGFPPGPPTMTDAAGNAVFQAVKPGRYTLTAQHVEYAGTPIKRSDEFAYVSRPTPSTFVIVDEKDLHPTATFFLSPFSSIAGRARNADGSPAGNARITLGTLRLEGGRRTFLSGPSVRTTAAGEYLLTGVASGDYALQVLAASPGASSVYYPRDVDLEKASMIFIEPGKEVAGIDIILP